MRDSLRRYYSIFRPLYLPILRSAPFKKMGLLPFDNFLMRARSQARLSRFHARYPFVLEREAFAMRLQTAADYSSAALNHAEVCGLFEEFFLHALGDDWNALVTAAIAVTFPDGVRHAAIDCRNTQFVGIKRSIVDYRNGFEPELAHLLDLLMPDDGVFVDVGSNWGYFSIYLATKPGYRGRIHAIEPVARSFADLQKLVASLRCDGVIACHQFAVSDAPGTAKMEEGIRSGLASIKDEAVAQGEIVRKLTLDSLNLQNVDFLKIDVEGHEANALRGAETLIETSKPYIFLESWIFPEPDKVFEPLRFLLDRGYRLYLPTWLQSNGTFFVGIGASHEMETFALVPFELRDRLCFPGNPINIFACPASREARLGERRTDGGGNVAKNT